MNKAFLVLVLVVSVSLSSCYDTYEISPPTVENLDTLDIFKIGRVLEYKVDSTFYFETLNPSTLDSQRKSTYYIKEEFYDTLRNSEGDLVYYALISRKNDSTSLYIPESTTTYTVKDNEVVWNTRNAPVVLFTFPLIQRGKWIANKYSNTDFVNVQDLNANNKSWNAEVLDIDTNYTFPHYYDGTTNFVAKAVYFQLADIFDGASKDYTDRINFKYMLVPQIGLVYKHEQAYILRNDITYRRGFEIKYYLIDYE